MTRTEIASVAPETALGRPAALPATPHPFAFVLVKLASRCNINCTYCYWFRDAEVYEKPPVLTAEAEDAFCLRLEEHIREFNLPVFLLVFHGGEPLLFPKRRFDALLKKLRDIEQRTGCVIKRGVTTNAILIDAAWVELFKTSTSTSPSASTGRPKSMTNTGSTSKAAARSRRRCKDWIACARLGSSRD